LRKVLLAVIGLAASFLVFITVLNLAPERRQVRNPIEHTFSTSDPQFLRTMNSVFGDDILPGHRIDTLVNGDEIFPAMLAAIAGARSTVNFETYIYWSGEIAYRFAETLAERSRAGVEVRVLVDWVGSQPFDQDVVDIMLDAGVAFERFRPVHWYTLDRVNNRTHRKILVVDGVIGFTGGVGIGDEWKGDARNPSEWRDNHYMIEGPAVAGLQAAFAENWLEARGEVLLGDRFYPEIAAEGEAAAQTIKSSPEGGSRSMHQMLLMALAAADSHIRIAMAYFVPDDVSIRQLIEARERGVEIDIILPNHLTDAAVVRYASRHFWGELLDAGIRIHEYQPTMYHPKFLVVDDNWVTMGSANFDERSFRINDEANVNVYDEAFAAEHIAIFKEDLARSRLISRAEWQERGLVTKISDWFWSTFRAQL
jgi:cardiolipin synthase A/B